MIKLNNLSVTFNPNTPFAKTVQKDIQLHVATGDKILIIGKSGSGKTTLIKVLAQIITPLTPPDCTYNFSELGYVGQFAEEQISELTVYDEISTTYQNFYQTPLPHNEFIAILAQFKMSHHQHSNSDQLSQGEKKIISFISSIIHQPKILLLDEILTNLDKTHKEIILDYLSKTDQTWVIVTHDPYAFANIKTKVIQIY